MARLIVHGDDFGLTERINAGILKAYQEGILSSTSVMAVGGAYENSIEIARAEKGLDVGVHLTLIGEVPLLHGSSVASLVTSEGRFFDNAYQFFIRYCCGKINTEEVYRELDAQIRRVLGSGIKVSHLDSHQHLHMLPGILKVAGLLAKKYNIRGIRFPREKIRPGIWRKQGLFRRVLQAQVLGCFCLLGRTYKTVASPDFYGFFSGGCLEKADVVSIIGNLSDGATAELMCHPGLDDPCSPYRRWNYDWQKELDVLLDPELPSLFKKYGVELISYRDVIDEL